MTAHRKKPGISLQDRDVALIRGLLECRVMTIPHAADIFFGGKREMAKKRLQRLKATGYVRERRRRAFEPGTLKRKGLMPILDICAITKGTYNHKRVQFSSSI